MIRSDRDQIDEMEFPCGKSPPRQLGLEEGAKLVGLELRGSGGARGLAQILRYKPQRESPSRTLPRVPAASKEKPKVQSGDS